MSISLEQAKQYSHLDYDYEDEFIKLLIENVEQFLKDSINNYDSKIANAKFEKKADLLKLMLIKDMFDNRDLLDKDNKKLRYSAQSLLNQMKFNTYE